MKTMNRTSLRLAIVASLSLAALPALALEPLWPALENPRPARLMAATPAGTPSAVSGDPTWPVVSSPMPGFTYASRTDSASVYEPAVEAHVTAMAASRQAAPHARLAAK
jgi:hypothetical protein